MQSLFQFIIYDHFDGCMKGTNDKDLAHSYSMCDDFSVLDLELGVHIVNGIPTLPLKEVEPIPSEGSL